MLSIHRILDLPRALLSDLLFMYIRLSKYLYVCLPKYLTVWQTVCLSVCLHNHLPAGVPNSLSPCPNVCLSIQISVCLPNSICLHNREYFPYHTKDSVAANVS